MGFSRRRFLFGLGGAVVGLPFLEGIAPAPARASDAVPPFALFYRRGNGVQQAIFDRNDYLPHHASRREPERWWPVQVDGITPIPYGALTTLGPLSAMNELATYVAKLTIVRGLRHPYGTENGHPEGFVQGLTGGGVEYPNDVPNPTECRPLGESLDNRIARELTPLAPESLYMGVKTENRPGVSWIKQGSTIFPRSAQEDLLTTYGELFLAGASERAARQLLVVQRKSVNDLVRADLISLRGDPRLSSGDRDRLAVHLDAIRDTEVALANCAMPEALLGEVRDYDRDSITAKITVIGKLAALAIACGVRRSVLINVGVPQDVITYREVAGAGTDEFHALSHRQISETGTRPLTAARDAHHAIDRYHLRRFKSIVDLLSAYVYPDGSTLLDKGTCIHFSDIGSGQHIVTQLPYLYVGGAAGALRTGLYVDVGKEYLVRFLNTIGAAVGCKNADGMPLDDFNADNNNHESRNYTWFWYDVPAPPKPANGAPPIKGRIAALVGP